MCVRGAFVELKIDFEERMLLCAWRKEESGCAESSGFMLRKSRLVGESLSRCVHSPRALCLFPFIAIAPRRTNKKITSSQLELEKPKPTRSL